MGNPTQTKRIHFISIGGAVMHNLALELHALGHIVTGSDDEIYDPSRSRLAAAGLLPQEMGWDESRITPEIDLILLGMHARATNPELLAAQKLGLTIHSFPSYIGLHSVDKKQVVVAGSHGKTTTTSMIMHVLKELQIDFDYLVGAQLQGFNRMVRLSDAPLIVIEGDEYLSSPIDRRPKFLHYSPDYLILTGIQWDHMNVFPTFEDYVGAFATLLNQLDDDCLVFYDKTDEHLYKLMRERQWQFHQEGYDALPYQVDEGKFYLAGSTSSLGVVGRHNMKNFAAAQHVLKAVGLETENIQRSFERFQGAAKRQDVLLQNDDIIVYRDFAHAPSKVRATLKGIRELYPDRTLIAVCELHTYSSLNKEFIPQYAGSMEPADHAAVFYSPKTLEIKKMPPLSEDDIRGAFDSEEINVMTDAERLNQFLVQATAARPAVLLLMSSGTFGGLDLQALLAEF